MVMQMSLLDAPSPPTRNSSESRAAANGMRTAHVARPQENPGISETGPRGSFDFAARDMEDLAGKLGA